MVSAQLLVAVLCSAPPPAAAPPADAAPEPATPADAAPEPTTPVDPITVERAEGGTATANEQFDRALRKALGDRFGATCAAEPCPRLHVGVRERERDYDMTVAVTREGDAPVGADVRCTICTPAEAGRQAAAKAIELLDGAPSVAHLAVESNPPGATVEIDGKAVGETPLRVELEPGPHEVVVREPGYLHRERHVELGVGGEELLRLELPKDRSREARAMRIAGWSLVGVGIAGIVGGIALIAVDENPVKSNCDGVHVDAFGNCEFRWNTLGAGVGVLVPGVLLTATGATLIAFGRRDRQGRPGTQARLRIGADAVSVRVRF